MNLQELVSQLETLKSMLSTSISNIEGEASRTAAQISLLEAAIQGFEPALAVRLNQLKTTYNGITQQLQDHQQYVNQVENAMNSLIAVLRSQG
jgi:predicted  nucleic acid-binding Zn-ribbon protein